MSHSRRDLSRQSHAISRRQLLQAAGVGAMALGSPGMVVAGVDPNQGLGRGAAATSCIVVLLCG